MEDDDITSDEEIEFKFRRGRHMTLADIQASLDQTSRRRMSALIQRENKKQKEVNTEDTGEDDVDGIVKKARPKSAGVLKNQSFNPPKIDALKKATEYRLLQGKQVRIKAPTVKLKRKKRVTIGQSSGSESEAEHTDRTYLVNEVDHGPGYFDPSEDYDFDCEDTPRYYEEERIHPSVVVYKSICKSLHVTPSSYFLKQLGSSEIVLRHHLLGDKGSKALAVALVDNLNVVKLHLEDNDVRSEGTKHIAEMLRENNTLTQLILIHNSIGSSGLSRLCQVLSPNENIVELDLTGNNLDENDTMALADLIEENTIIKDLNLSHNTFREKGGAILAHALCSNDAIEILNLSWNHLRRRGAVAIAECLSTNISITHLDISWNGFYLDGCRALSKSLRVNRTLETLNLNCNRIDFECLMELLKGISANSTLTTLLLADNPISTEGALEIVKLIKNKPSIKISKLDISTQSINVQFLALYEEIRERQDIHIKHGIYADQDGKDMQTENVFSHEDPMMVLMELMRVMGLRLIDLFSALDKDQSRSLTKDEFKSGLMSIHVPLTEKAVERLVKKLDTDGNGEVDYGELLEGQKLHKLKLRRLQQLEDDLPFVETELGRIHIKLKHLMSAGRNEALKKAEEERAQRAKDRMIAMGQVVTLTPRSENNNQETQDIKT